MRPPRFAKPFRARLPGVATAEALLRMAWAPSYRAPRAIDVLRPEPFLPPARPTWAELGAKDLVECDGRVESVSLSGRAFISLAGPLFETHPPREIRLVAIKWFVDELAQCPHLAQVERLNLAGNQIGCNRMRTLAGSPFLRASFLDLTNNNLGQEGVAVLLSAPWSRQISELKLAGNGLKANDIDRLRSALSPLTVDTIG
jgi:hypothetical protein